MKTPVAPLGTMFWFRARAMEKLFAREWAYEDFPAEPTGENDGNILHAIERDAVHEALHVLHRVDGHTRLAHVTGHTWMIRVVAAMRG